MIKTNDWHPAILVMRERIELELSNGKKVLWLLSGGSNVNSGVLAMQNIPDELTNNLSVMLMDERYGIVGHDDSNDEQLAKAGFDQKSSRYIHVLRDNTSFEATRERYEAEAKAAFSESDIIIGLFGLGADGHTAGILPHSVAVDSPDFVAAYASSPYQRLTLTDHALKRINVAYLLAYGADKEPALELLASKMIPYAEQPAQLIKEIPEAYVFNDRVGESV